MERWTIDVESVQTVDWSCGEGDSRCGAGEIRWLLLRGVRTCSGFGGRGHAWHGI